MMKMNLRWLLVIAMLCVSVNACAQNDVLSAFEQLTGKRIELNQGEKSGESYLREVMDGVYLSWTGTQEEAESLAQALPGLSAVTAKDIAVYASGNGLEDGLVRNRYYRSLANVLRAEIMVNPASQEHYKNIQIILSLFLENSDDETSAATRKAIRSSMTRSSARDIAVSYNLPTAFVEFVMMDDNWNDDDWQNDDAWLANVGAAYADTFNSDAVFETIADAPKYNTPNTPDYNTPNTPKYNTPATPDYNTPATPKYNTPATPDYNTPDDSKNSKDYDS